MKTISEKKSNNNIEINDDIFLFNNQCVAKIKIEIKKNDLK
jgi:hypothetical protein